MLENLTTKQLLNLLYNYSNYVINFNYSNEGSSIPIHVLDYYETLYKEDRESVFDRGVLDRIKKVIKECIYTPEEDISLDSRLCQDLGADDLDEVEIVMELEKEFNIEILDEDAEDVKTVEDLYRIVIKEKE